MLAKVMRTEEGLQEVEWLKRRLGECEGQKIMKLRMISAISEIWKTRQMLKQDF